MEAFLICIVLSTIFFGYYLNVYPSIKDKLREIESSKNIIRSGIGRILSVINVIIHKIGRITYVIGGIIGGIIYYIDFFREIIIDLIGGIIDLIGVIGIILVIITIQKIRF